MKSKEKIWCPDCLEDVNPNTHKCLLFFDPLDSIRHKSENVLWVLNCSVNDINYKNAIPRLSDEDSSMR